MKKLIFRVTTVVITLILAFSVCFVLNAKSTDDEITVLFTHDLHSHLLPSANENGKGEYGGYARLMTLIKEQKEIDPDAILVDGGDFSMGSLFQTAYATSAIELRMMGAMGYDVTTFGNHEYDYLQSGFQSMLNAAVASDEPLPSIVCANYLPPKAGQDGYDASMWDAMNNYGVQEVFVKNGEARLKDGTLAGSVLKMNVAVKNLVEKVGVSFTDAIDFATKNPAENIGVLSERGTIEVGKRADFTVLDNEFNVLYTIVGGKVVYKA